MKRALLAALTVALLAACGPTGTPGPDGTVTRHDRTRYRLGWHYWLTVTTPNGESHQFRVQVADYRHCADGSHYPACTNRGAS